MNKALTANHGAANVIKHGPLTWVRRDNGGCECWDVVLPKGVNLTHFCVKNYGGEPNDENSFSGWRVVSGGPFTRAGGWTSRDDAIAGATPWLVDYYTSQATDRHREATEELEALRAFLNKTKRS